MVEFVIYFKNYLSMYGWMIYLSKLSAMNFLISGEK
ncbi:TPA: hypothetical protein ACU2KI_002713 [Staphylococcus aureus]